jgi:hypothetical protein
MSQPGKKMNCVLPNCRLAMGELDARFSSKYQTALIERDNPVTGAATSRGSARS